MRASLPLWFLAALAFSACNCNPKPAFDAGAEVLDFENRLAHVKRRNVTD